MKNLLKRIGACFLAVATVVTTLPITQAHAESNQYWTESIGHVGMVEQVMNDGSISLTFNEGHLVVEGEEAFCEDINTAFQPGYKTRVNTSKPTLKPKVGDKVKVIKAINYDTGKYFALYYDKYDLLELSGNRAVIGIGKTVTSAIHINNIKKA